MKENNYILKTKVKDKAIEYTNMGEFNSLVICAMVYNEIKQDINAHDLKMWVLEGMAEAMRN